jgi:hypothetical protein
VRAGLKQGCHQYLCKKKRVRTDTATGFTPMSLEHLKVGECPTAGLGTIVLVELTVRKGPATETIEK